MPVCALPPGSTAAAQLRDHGHRRRRHRGQPQTPPRSPAAEQPGHAPLAGQTPHSHLPVTPAGRRQHGEDRPAPGQQPSPAAPLLTTPTPQQHAADPRQAQHAQDTAGTPQTTTPGQVSDNPPGTPAMKISTQ